MRPQTWWLVPITETTWLGKRKRRLAKIWAENEWQAQSKVESQPTASARQIEHAIQINAQACLHDCCTFKPNKTKA